MKIVKVLLPALIAGIVLIGCGSKKPKDLIVNKWKLTDISGGEAAQMPDSLKKEIMKVMSLEFTKDGKYTIVTGGGSDETGTYTVSDDGKTLSTTKTGGTEDKVAIDEISKDKMVISKDGTKMVCAPK